MLVLSARCLLLLPNETAKKKKDYESKCKEAILLCFNTSINAWRALPCNGGVEGETAEKWQNDNEVGKTLTGRAAFTVHSKVQLFSFTPTASEGTSGEQQVNGLQHWQASLRCLLSVPLLLRRSTDHRVKTGMAPTLRAAAWAGSGKTCGTSGGSPRPVFLNSDVSLYPSSVDVRWRTKFVTASALAQLEREENSRETLMRKGKRRKSGSRK